MDMGTVKKNSLIIIGSVLSSIVLGVVIAFGYGAVNGEQHHVYDIENRELPQAYGSKNGFKIRIDSLEEEMWFVDMVIYGKVLEQGSTYQQNANINQKFDFPVTPSTVLVHEAVIGKVEEDKITLLQHGSLLEQNSESKLVSEGDEYILFLMEAPLGGYWPYDAQNGIWNVKDGLVSSNTADIHLTHHLNNLPVEEFIKIIEKAGKNKKKPASLP